MSDTLFCSGNRSITGKRVDGSNSVELAPVMPATWRANSATATCSPRQRPKKGTPFSRAYFTDMILPSMPRTPKPPGTRMPSASSSRAVISSCRQGLGVDPDDLEVAAVVDGRVAERLDDAEVGVAQLHVLAHERDAHGAGRRLEALDQRDPLVELRGLGLETQRLDHQPVQALVAQVERARSRDAGRRCS